MPDHYLYILAGRKDGVLYIGVTNDLKRRVYEHKMEIIKGFTAKYHIHRLVYYEVHSTHWDAAVRESRMKKWKRDWKIGLFRESNPEWRDLYDTL